MTLVPAFGYMLIGVSAACYSNKEHAYGTFFLLCGITLLMVGGGVL